MRREDLQTLKEALPLLASFALRLKEKGLSPREDRELSSDPKQPVDGRVDALKKLGSSPRIVSASPESFMSMFFPSDAARAQAGTSITVGLSASRSMELRPDLNPYACVEGWRAICDGLAGYQVELCKMRMPPLAYSADLPVAEFMVSYSTARFTSPDLIDKFLESAERDREIAEILRSFGEFQVKSSFRLAAPEDISELTQKIRNLFGFLKIWWVYTNKKSVIRHFRALEERKKELYDGFRKSALEPGLLLRFPITTVGAKEDQLKIDLDDTSWLDQLCQECERSLESKEKHSPLLVCSEIVDAAIAHARRHLDADQNHWQKAITASGGLLMLLHERRMMQLMGRSAYDQPSNSRSGKTGPPAPQFGFSTTGMVEFFAVGWNLRPDNLERRYVRGTQNGVYLSQVAPPVVASAPIAAPASVVLAAPAEQGQPSPTLGIGQGVVDGSRCKSLDEILAFVLKKLGDGLPCTVTNPVERVVHLFLPDGYVHAAKLAASPCAFNVEPCSAKVELVVREGHKTREYFCEAVALENIRRILEGYMAARVPTPERAVSPESRPSDDAKEEAANDRGALAGDRSFSQNGHRLLADVRVRPHTGHEVAATKGCQS